MTSVIAAVLVFVYRFVCLYDNRRRDATGVLEGFENAYQDDLTDKTVSPQPLPSRQQNRPDNHRILNSDIPSSIILVTMVFRANYAVFFFFFFFGQLTVSHL